QRMAEYLVLYNSKRPHKSLELMTPVDYILRESKNCNMWWTHTIARGQVPPNPSELLMHPRFAALLEWANEHYDLVLVDTPPLLAVTDAAIVGRLAGTVFLVARFAVTAAKEVEITQRRLEQNGIEVKGVILNAMEKRAAGYYGGSYGYYQYSYQSSGS
ncbi:protein-tyrosine kinase, partial [Klebsiella quasipneumoniae subsp. similipneumoniae]